MSKYIERKRWKRGGKWDLCNDGELESLIPPPSSSSSSGPSFISSSIDFWDYSNLTGRELSRLIIMDGVDVDGVVGFPESTLRRPLELSP